MSSTASGGAPVFLEAEGHDLRVRGHGIIVKPKHRYLCAPETIVAAADLDSLAAAVRDPQRCCGSMPDQVLIAECTEDDFDEDFVEPTPVSIEIGEDAILALCSVIVGPDRGTTEDYLACLEPAAKRHHCRVADVRLLDESGSDDALSGLPLPESELAALRDEESRRPKFLEVRVAPMKPMLAGQLLAAGRDVHALLLAIRAGPLSATTTRDLLIAKLPHLLIGLPESEWFEAKSRPYALNAPEKGAAAAAKIELAQDVARFVNGNVDSLLVIGLTTRVKGDREVVERVTPSKLNTISPRQHLDVIDSRVYPNIEGIRVDQVELGSGKGLLVVYIPTQPAAYRPFLVHGAVVNGRVEQTFVSIVKRRGDASVPATPSQIHSMLVAGRAVLEGGRANEPSREGPD